jgi:hypothetical protein
MEAWITPLLFLRVNATVRFFPAGPITSVTQLCYWYLGKPDFDALGFVVI